MSPLLRTAVVALGCAIAALAIGTWLGGHPDRLPQWARNAFVDDDRALRAELIDRIEEDFYKDVSGKDLEEESLKGMVRSLGDRFSEYFTPAEARQLRQSLSSQFEGIGVTVQPEDRGLKIVSVFEGSPASKVGIHKADVIVGVNGRSIAGVPSDVATGRIKGPAGTSVSLSVLTPGRERPRRFRVERAKIEVPIAKGRLVREDGVPIAYVRLAAFNVGAHAAVRDELEPLLRRGARGIVLDLRGNGGGLLEEGVLVSSLFVERGPIVSTRGRARPKREFDAEGDAIATREPMVVLVDGGTASASEIVTGALRDRGRARVVGEKTFGKGVFQEVESLSNGGVVELTVGSYYLPRGENLANKGIRPTVPARDVPRTRRDEALPVALDVVAASVR
ncbi:MAG TPA: S41 family peptidase [Thermoleophilaceae bacterium]|jgi:carboxyl-terminal processing protease